MKLFSTTFLAAGAALALAACTPEPPRAASPGVGAPQNVQQEGGGNVTVQRAPSTGTTGTRQRITAQRPDGSIDRGANVGAPSTQGPAPTGTTATTR